jgi:hypothetical protein
LKSLLYWARRKTRRIREAEAGEVERVLGITLVLALFFAGILTRVWGVYVLVVPSALFLGAGLVAVASLAGSRSTKAWFLGLKRRYGELLDPFAAWRLAVLLLGVATALAVAAAVVLR